MPEISDSLGYIPNIETRRSRKLDRIKEFLNEKGEAIKSKGKYAVSFVPIYGDWKYFDRFDMPKIAKVALTATMGGIRSGSIIYSIISGEPAPPIFFNLFAAIGEDFGTYNLEKDKVKYIPPPRNLRKEVR